MSKKPDKKPELKFDPEFIRDISEAAYRQRLEQECAGNVARMLEKDGDGGKKLRGRAAAYDTLTRCYLDVFGFTPNNPPEIPQQ